MKSLKNKMLPFLILLFTFSGIAYGQNTAKDTLPKTRSFLHDSVIDVKTDNMAYRDAFAYREIADSLNDGLDSAKTLINDQNQALNTANNHIKTQSAILDEQVNDNAILKNKVEKLERKAKRWSNVSGILAFIATVSIMIILK